MLLVPSVAFAQEPSSEVAFECRSEAWPEQDRAPMLAAQARGLELARRDRFAWVGTDRLGEQVGSVNGYVIEDTGAEARVHFFRRGEPLRLLVDVVFDAKSPDGRVARPRAGGKLKADSPIAAAYRAGMAAQHDPRFAPKATNYNQDVLRWSEDPAAGWAVYLVPGATEFSAVPLGGGYLAQVSADGRTVHSVTPLSVSVLTFDVETLKANANGMAITTVLSPYPDATYVAWSAIWDVPLVVVTPSRSTWMIHGDRLCRADLPEE